MPPKKLGKGGRTKALLEKVKKKVTTLVSRSGSGDFANQSIANSQPPSSTSAPSGGPAPPSSLPSPTPEPDPLPPVNWALHGLHARHRRPVLDRSLMHYGKYATSYRKRKRRLPGPEEEWVLRGTVAVDDIPMWFERELQDFGKGKSEVASCVQQHWFTPPGRTPDDWRARNFCFTWKPHVTDAERALAIASDAVVATVSYPCKGSHRRPGGLLRKAEMEAAAKAERDKKKAQKELEMNSNLEAEDDRSQSQAGRDEEGEGYDEEGEGYDEEGEGYDEEEEEEPDDPNRWHRCKNGPKDNVVVVLEVKASNLSVAEIWQLNEHDDVNIVEQWLDYSKQLKNFAEVILTQFTGLTHSQTAHSIAKNLLPRFRMSLRHGDDVPVFRDISEEQIKNLTTAARRRLIAIQNVVIAIERVVYAVPDRIFGYKPLLETDERTQAEFTLGVKDNFSIDTWILYASFTGGFIDSTWRGMNQAGCPIYIIGTATDHGNSPHFAPTAVIYSEGSSFLIVRTILKAFVAAVLYRCAEICAGTAITLYDRPEELAVLQAVAKYWLQEGGVLPAFFMTDMDQAQIKALQHCFPTVPIRICQFHLVQAIFRWQTRHGKRMNGPNLPKTIRLRIIIAFNRLQRCREMSAWPEMVGAFYDEVDAIIDSATDEDEPEDLSEDAAPLDLSTTDAVPANSAPPDPSANAGPSLANAVPVAPSAPISESSAAVKQDGGEYVPEAVPTPSAATQSSPGAASATKKKPRFKLTTAQRTLWKESVHTYFDDWLFRDPTWIPMFTDIGMPEGQTRERTWNTNNWIEAAIRIFGRVFLDCRKNKRVDRLLWIIIKEYLPFYSTWRSSPRFRSSPDPPKELQDLFAEAHRLWADGAVEQLGENLFRVVYETKDPAGTVRQINFTVDTQNPDCKCDSFSRNGKICVHVQAAELYRTIGSAAEVELEETRSMIQAKYFREKKIMALERRIRPREPFTGQAPDGSIFFPTDNPLKKDLKPEDYVVGYDDRPPGTTHKREKFLCDERINERVYSICEAVSKLPETVTRPGPSHPSLTPMAPWRVKGVNVERYTMDTLKELQERGPVPAMEFPAGIQPSRPPDSTLKPIPRGTPSPIPRTNSKPVTAVASSDLSSIQLTGSTTDIPSLLSQDSQPPSGHRRDLAPPNPVMNPPEAQPLAPTVVPSPQEFSASVETPQSSNRTLVPSLLITPPNLDRSPPPSSPSPSPHTPSTARSPNQSAPVGQGPSPLGSKPLPLPSIATHGHSNRHLPTPSFSVPIQSSVQLSPQTPPLVRPTIPLTPPTFLQAYSQNACACPAPGSAEDLAKENTFDPQLPRAEAESDTGDANTPFDTVHGIHTIDRRRWRTGAMMLSAEMTWFVRLLNSLSAKLDRRIVFIHIATGCLDILSRIDWSINWDSATAEDELLSSLSQEERYGENGGASQFARLIRCMRSMRPTKIVFLHLEDEHWTSFVHDLGTRAVTCIQTLGYLIDVDIWSQYVISLYVGSDKPSTCPNSPIEMKEYPNDILRVQKDGVTCGYWQVWIGLGMVLGLPIRPQSDFLQIHVREIIEHLIRLSQHFLVLRSIAEAMGYQPQQLWK